MEPGLSPKEFRDAFSEMAAVRYDFGWMLVSGDRPAGAIFAIGILGLLFIADTVWFPWATPRQKIETMVHWINEMRRDMKIIEFARPEDKRFWEHIAKHGIMRRVGTVHDVYGQPSPLFESRVRQ